MAKITISLCIQQVRLESLLDTFWMAENAQFLHADEEDSDQTARTHHKKVLQLLSYIKIALSPFSMQVRLIHS